MGFSLVNHPFWGSPIDGKPHIKQYKAIWRFSINADTPKSSISIGFSLVNHLFLGTPHLWKAPYQTIVGNSDFISYSIVVNLQFLLIITYCWVLPWKPRQECGEKPAILGVFLWFSYGFPMVFLWYTRLKRLRRERISPWKPRQNSVGIFPSATPRPQ